MTLALLKVFLAPFFIWVISILQKRFGAKAGGFFIGLPLTTGPFLIIVALQEGGTFAKLAAHGVMVGQISLIIFAYTYAQFALRLNWLAAIISASLAVVTSGYICQLIPFNNWQVTLTLIVLWLLALKFWPKYEKPLDKPAPPQWELPLRLFLAALFIIVLTWLANELGTKLSGAISTYPVILTVLGSLTHRRYGPKYIVDTLHGLAQIFMLTPLIMLAIVLI